MNGEHQEFGANPPQEPATAGDAPVKPSQAVRDELSALLEADDSRLGQVYVRRRDGKDPETIAQELGVSTSRFVWNYDRTARALLDADLPTATTVAQQTGRTFRSILKSPTLSAETRSYLEVNLAELERRANDPERQAAEDRQAQDVTRRAEDRNEAGIYVCALPHYLRYRFDPRTGHTLMKVGHSRNDAMRRFLAARRVTELPEEPVLLRIYRTGDADSAALESEFHGLLEAADHSRSIAHGAGREWFLTTLRFLDRIAQVLRLDIEVINDDDSIDDT